MTLRARACLDLAELASGQQAEGLRDLPEAVAEYERVLGAGAPETQLFRFLFFDESRKAGRVPANIEEQLKRMAAERIAEAAPWEDWSSKLSKLKAELTRFDRTP
jgi:hypothetical protein